MIVLSVKSDFPSPLYTSLWSRLMKLEHELRTQPMNVGLMAELGGVLRSGEDYLSIKAPLPYPGATMVRERESCANE